MSAPSKVWFCHHSLAGVADSNAVDDTGVCLLCVLCVVMSRALRRAYHSSRAVLTECDVSVCDRKASIMSRPWPTTSCCVMEKKKKRIN